MALENAYHVDNRSIDFTFLLKGLFPLINRQFKKHIVHAEGVMLRVLQTHKQNLQMNDVKDLLVNLHTPIIYAYILFGSILISIFAMPFICCTQGPCSKKAISPSKWKDLCFVPVEILLFLVFGICLVLGIVGLCQTTLSIQEILMVFPPMWRNIVLDLALNRYAFKIQVISVINNIKTSSDLIINETSQIPTIAAGYVINEKLNRNLNISLSFLNVHPFQAEIIFNKSSFLPNQKSVTHSLEYEFEIIRKKLRDFFNRGNGSGDIFTTAANFFEKEHKFPKWTILYSNLQSVFQKSLPNTIHALDFKNNLLIEIQKSSQREIKRITRGMVRLHELASTVDHKIDMAIAALLSKTAQDFLIRHSYGVEHYLSHFKILNRNDQNVFMNCNLWIMLIPCIVVLILFLLIVYTFVFSIEELKRIIVNAAYQSSRLYNMYPSKSTKTLQLFRICMLFSISILWFLLILTTIFYCAHLPLSIFCEAINDQHIYTDYIDKPSVWNNKTWLDNKLYRFLPSHKSELRVRKLLDECYLNKTLYKSLGMHQYWNISRNINDLLILMNVTTLQKIVSKAVTGMKTPEGEINNLFKEFRTIENNFNLPNISDIKEIIKNFNSNWEHKLQNEIKNKIEDEKFIKLWNEVIFLNQVHFPNLLGNMSDLINLKNYLKNMRKEFVNIKLIVGNVSPIIEEAPKKINQVLEIAAIKINTIIAKLVKETINQVENKVGNCYVLPFAYDKAVWSVCDHGLSVINGAWLSLGIICISIVLCTIFSCTLSGHIGGAHRTYSIWRGNTMESHRYSNQTARLNVTFLFNKSISATGSSFTMTEENVNKAN